MPSVRYDLKNNKSLLKRSISAKKRGSTVGLRCPEPTRSLSTASSPAMMAARSCQPPKGTGSRRVASASRRSTLNRTDHHSVETWSSNRLFTADGRAEPCLRTLLLVWPPLFTTEQARPRKRPAGLRSIAHAHAHARPALRLHRSTLMPNLEPHRLPFVLSIHGAGHPLQRTRGQAVITCGPSTAVMGWAGPWHVGCCNHTGQCSLPARPVAPDDDASQVWLLAALRLSGPRGTLA